MLTDDGRTTDAGVIGILIAHLGAFGSGELKMDKKLLSSPFTRLYLGSIGMDCVISISCY